jgi:histidine ammonia-lyase
MTLVELASIAHGARVELEEAALERMRASRAVVERALASGEPIYGVNTGVGHARDVRLPEERLRAMQPTLVTMHVGSIGEPLPREVVRAAMAARVNGLARGGSGASPAVAEMLVALLNAGVHPVVPADGSVGAGDLSHHAAVGLVALGLGHAEVEGVVVSGADALRSAGLEPLELEPKDGLALVSASGFTLGEGALVLERAHGLLAIADAVAATSLDAYAANPSVLEPAVQEAKGSAGQARSAARMRARLEGGVHDPATLSVQDPLSFRVAPQVHGACADLLDSASAALAVELNAAADNPLASISAGRVISNGNFHPVLVAISFDALRPALGHVGQLSERRLGHLWERAIGGSSAPDPGDLAEAPPWIVGLHLRYSAAARYTRLRQLADPVTLDVPSLDFGQEDHSTNALEAVRRTGEALDVLADLLAIELLNANVLVAPSTLRFGDGTRRVAERLARLLAGLQPASSPDVVVRAVAETLPRLVEEF